MNNPRLTVEQLRQLIAGGEIMDVQFKSDSPNPLSDKKLVESAVCLANKPGASPSWLLVGIENDGTITGVTSRGGATISPPEIAARIGARTTPGLPVQVQLINIDNHQVLAIRVDPSPTPVCTSNGTFLRRTWDSGGRPACVPFTYSEMQSLLASKEALDITALPLPRLSMSDLDPLEITRYRQHVANNPHRSDWALAELDDTELCKAIPAVGVDGAKIVVKVLGVLLFGFESILREVLPTHEIAFQHANGTQL